MKFIAAVTAFPSSTFYFPDRQPGHISVTSVWQYGQSFNTSTFLIFLVAQNLFYWYQDAYPLQLIFQNPAQKKSRLQLKH